MESLPTALILSHWLEGSEAVSALPDAPVVAHVEPGQHLRRTRSAAASALYRLGDVMAPPRPTCSSRSLG
jgi:hypothetical protein